MEKEDFDKMKELMQRKIITQESFITRVIDFAKVFLEKNMKLEVVKVVQKKSYGGKIIAEEKGSPVKLAVKVAFADKCTKQEFEIWPSLKHPNVIRLLDMQYIPRIDSHIFITEYHFCTLEDYLQNGVLEEQRDSPAKIKRFLWDILEGLEYLHSREFSHLNLRAKNILISTDNKAVIKNFRSLDTAADLPEDTAVAFNYGPPELCFRNEYQLNLAGVHYDIWSFGILALNIFTKGYLQKKIPEDANWHRKIYPTLFKILQLYKFSKYIKKAFPISRIGTKLKKIKINFLITCLRIIPIERPSANMLLKHKYFMAVGGFTSVYKQPWNKRIYIKPDCWIDEIMNSAPYLNLTPNGNPSQSRRKSSSEDDSNENSRENNENSSDIIENQDTKSDTILIDKKGNTEKITEPDSKTKQSPTYSSSGHFEKDAPSSSHEMKFTYSEKKSEEITLNISKTVSSQPNTGDIFGSLNNQETEFGFVPDKYFTESAIKTLSQPTPHDTNDMSQKFPKQIHHQRTSLPNSLSKYDKDIKSHEHLIQEWYNADKLVKKDDQKNKNLESKNFSDKLHAKQCTGKSKEKEKKLFSVLFKKSLIDRKSYDEKKPFPSSLNTKLSVIPKDKTLKKVRFLENKPVCTPATECLLGSDSRHIHNKEEEVAAEERTTQASKITSPASSEVTTQSSFKKENLAEKLDIAFQETEDHAEIRQFDSRIYGDIVVTDMLQTRDKTGRCNGDKITSSDL